MNALFLLFVLAVIFLAGFLIYSLYHNYMGQGKADDNSALSQQQLYSCYFPDYCAYAQLLSDCIANNYSSIGLNRPGSMPQNLAPNLQGIKVLPNGRIGFIYIFDRSPVFSGGGLHNVQYSTVPLNTMIKKLNSTLPNYAISAGYPPCQIITGSDLRNGRVALVITA